LIKNLFDRTAAQKHSSDDIQSCDRHFEINIERPCAHKQTKNALTDPMGIIWSMIGQYSA